MGTKVVKEVVAEVRASTARLDADLATAERKLGRTRSSVEGLGTASTSMAARYGGAARQIASATEEIARSGNVAGGAAKQILTAGASIAFAFGPAGAAVSALGIFGLAVATAMGRARDETEKTERAFTATLEKFRLARDYRGAGGTLTTLLQGNPAVEDETAAERIGLIRLREQVAQARAAVLASRPEPGTRQTAGQLSERRANIGALQALEAALASLEKKYEEAEKTFTEIAQQEQERLATEKDQAEQREEIVKAERAIIEERARVQREYAEATQRTTALIAEFDKEAAAFGANFDRFALTELGDAADQVAAQFDELIAQGRRTAGASDPRVQQLEAYKATAVEATRALERTQATFEALERGSVSGEAPGADAFSELSLRAEELNAQLATLTPRTKLYLQVQQELLKVERERSKLLDKIAKAEGKKDGAEEAPRTAADLAREIQQAVDGALQLAQAFGVVEDSVGRVLRAVSQVVGNLPALQAALASGGGLGIVSAALPIAGALASLFTDSPADEARRDALRKNTEAIKELTARAGVLGISLSAGNAQRALVDLEKFNLGGPGPVRVGPGLGVDMANLERAAAALGITLDGSAASFRALQDALTDTITKLGEFGTDVDSQLRQADAAAKIFGITDPLGRLQLTLGALGGRSSAFDNLTKGLDLSTAAGREAARRNAQALFEVLKAGGEKLDPSQFLGLDGQQLLDALLALVSGLNEVDESLGVNTSTATQADRIITADRTQITADQASRMLGIQQAQLNALRRIEETTAMILRSAYAAAVTPIPLPSASVFGGGSSTGVISIVQNIELNLSGAVDRQQIAGALMDDLVELVKRALGQDVAVRRQYQGQGTIR